MKKIACICLVIAYVIFPRPSAVQSQLAVFDAANEVHNIQQVFQQVTQITHQVTQIEQLYETIRLALINLENIDDLLPLLRRLDFSLKVLSRTSGVPYQTPEVLAKILRMYPTFGGHYPGIFQYQENMRLLNEQRWFASQDAMMGQAIEQELILDRADLDRQIAASRGAPGNLSALQAGNELSAMNTTQVLRLQQIESTNGRLMASDILAEAAKEDMERARIEWQTVEWEKNVHGANGGLARLP